MFRLKTQKTIEKLDGLQSLLDDKDTALRKANFTRSPFQSLSFLVTYAGLDDKHRTQVIDNLNTIVIKNLNTKPTSSKFSKDELNKLIEEIEWKEILPRKSKYNLNFEFKVALNDKQAFLEGIRANGPDVLYEALRKQNCIIQIYEAPEVIFTTNITQIVAWKKKFEVQEPYWIVSESGFVVDQELKKIIEEMQFGQKISLGAFSVKKGSASTELHIKKPFHRDYYRSEVINQEVGLGIYETFKLENFYGVEKVDDIKVELSNTASFSTTGAAAFQSQKVTVSQENCSAPSNSTVITIENLFVHYKGMDVMVNNLNKKQGMGGESDTLNKLYRITLEIKPNEPGVGIDLYSSPLTPRQIHKIHFDQKKIVELEESLSSGSGKIEYLFQRPTELILEPIESYSPPSKRLRFDYLNKIQTLFGSRVNIDGVSPLLEIQDQKNNIPWETSDQIEQLLLNMEKIKRKKKDSNTENLFIIFLDCVKYITFYMLYFKKEPESTKQVLTDNLIDLQMIGLDLENETTPATAKDVMQNIKILRESIVAWSFSIVPIAGCSSINIHSMNMNFFLSYGMNPTLCDCYEYMIACTIQNTSKTGAPIVSSLISTLPQLSISVIFEYLDLNLIPKDSSTCRIERKKPYVTFDFPLNKKQGERIVSYFNHMIEKSATIVAKKKQSIEIKVDKRALSDPKFTLNLKKTIESLSQSSLDSSILDSFRIESKAINFSTAQCLQKLKDATHLLPKNETNLGGLISNINELIERITENGLGKEDKDRELLISKVEAGMLKKTGNKFFAANKDIRKALDGIKELKNYCKIRSN